MFFLFFALIWQINVAHPVFLRHIQSLLSGYAPASQESVHEWLSYSLCIKLVCKVVFYLKNTSRFYKRVVELWTTGSSFPSGGERHGPSFPDARSLTNWCVVCINPARAASEHRSARRMQKRERPDSDGSSSIFKHTGDADRRWRRTARASVGRSQRWPAGNTAWQRGHQSLTASAFRRIWAWKTQQHWWSHACNLYLHTQCTCMHVWVDTETRGIRVLAAAYIRVSIRPEMHTCVNANDCTITHCVFSNARARHTCSTGVRTLWMRFILAKKSMFLD